MKIEEISSFSPAMAVPITVKLPEPMTAPIPSEVRLSQPSVFFRLRSELSESAISLSMSLTRNNCDPITFSLCSGQLFGPLP